MKDKIILLLIMSLLFSLHSIAQDGRLIRPFNDGWQFKRGPFPKDELEFMKRWDKGWKDVTIPHTWNAKDMQTRTDNFYQGEAYYRKSFFVADSLKGKRMFLRFEGVGQVIELYVNGTFVGNHKGGYSAFAFDISNAVNYGKKNELLLRVNNKARPDVIPVNHNLFGVYGGVYRPVWMIITNDVNIAVTDDASPGVYISQKNVSHKRADVEVKVKLVNKEFQPKPVTLEVAIYDEAGKPVASKKTDIIVSPQGMQSFNQDFVIKKPHLWQGRKEPYLYKVVTLLKENGSIIDNVTQPLGLRKIEVMAGKGVFLNGEKYPMYGVCRHQDWWGLGSALENKNHDTDLALMMEMGVTTIRLAHYQQSDYFYSKCDSLGLLVWAEIPFVNQVTTEEGPNAKSQLRELIKQSYNHPSIYTWGLHNEVYQPYAYTARLTQDLHELAKTEDPGRYTVSVNGYGIMDHPVNLNADIQGMNRYFGWYEKTIQDIEPWVEGLEEKYPHERLMLTEYGAGANIHQQTEYIGNTIKWWGDFYPETYQTKLHEIQWGVIKDHPYILASYIWNMFDFCVPKWKRAGVEARNLKGLVTFDRKVKKDAFYWYKANWSDEPVVYITQRRLKEREKQITTVTVYSNVGVPTVTLNNVRLTGVKMGTTDVAYVFENVKLQKGKNIVKASVQKDDKVYSDEVEWNFTKEQRRDTNEFLNEKVHFGF